MSSAALQRTLSFYTQAKTNLLRRREELVDRERRVGRDLRRAAEPLLADFADRAIQLQNDAPLAGIGAAAQDELMDIETALQRLDQGYYGICQRCGDSIGHERLAIVPAATRCINCATR